MFPYSQQRQHERQDWDGALTHSCIAEATMSDKKDLATEGGEDRLEGAGNVVGGRIRNAAGGVTGKTGEQLKGKAQELKGKVQDAIGKAKQKSDPNPGVDDA
jgi:uncharacterized protein YjbJ (UPF0337 family)